MRNGNFQADKMSHISVICSYPTYEEWKHYEQQQKKFNVFGSYPTYEEWKHCMSPLAITFLFRSYPTYEEWKLELKKRKEQKLQVLILPMRNGNNTRPTFIQSG